jgi:hypothetical protein
MGAIDANIMKREKKMCTDWLGREGVRGFLNGVKERAQARRDRDGPQRFESFRGGEPGSAPAPGKRAEADLCYAFSVKDGRFYVGYSGYSGGMTYRIPGSDDEYHDVTLGRETTQSARRQERFRQEVDELLNDVQLKDRPFCNCAEACAVSIAKSWNQSLEDLVFVTFYRRRKSDRSDDLKTPCENCMKWITAARSYCDKDGEFHCRSDRGPGSGGVGPGKEIAV